MELETKKKKKDFKIRQNLVLEFEKLAPSGKQTAIVENLIAGWIREQKRTLTAVQVKKAYDKQSGK